MQLVLRLGISYLWIDTFTTYEEDRMSAIAGIAAMLSRILWKKMLPSEDTSYYAGLWRYQFWFQLSWQVLCASEPTRPAQYRAPSWSWASVNVDVLFDLNIYTNYFTRLIDIPDDGVKVQPKGRIYGPSQSGTLLVWCNLCPVPEFFDLNFRDHSRGPNSSSSDSEHDRLLAWEDVHVSWDDFDPNCEECHLVLMPLSLSPVDESGNGDNDAVIQS